MHFYYLDEAGCTGSDLASTEQPVFVLGGISVRDEGWNATHQRFHQAVQKYFGGQVPQGFELHAEELLSPDGSEPFAGDSRQQRNNLAREVIGLLEERSHDVHFFAIDKAKLRAEVGRGLPNDISPIPYAIAYDYMVTYINHFVKTQLGQSARAMLIIDAKEAYIADIEQITRQRRFKGPASHRVKWLVEFSYPVDSRKNPMIQLSDMVVFCVKKFLEIEGGYREQYAQEAKEFFAQCYEMIDNRVRRKGLVERQGRGMEPINELLSTIRAQPASQWKGQYNL